MNDAIAKVLRELPDTDRSRYDIAYERGRAQARSLMLFGGIAVGAMAGAAATFLLDPERGKARRDALATRVGNAADHVRSRLDRSVEPEPAELEPARPEPAPPADHLAAPIAEAPNQRVPETVVTH